MWSYMSLSFLQKRSGVSIWKETPSSEGPETIGLYKPVYEFLYICEHQVRQIVKL